MRKLRLSTNGKGSGCQEPDCPLKLACKPDDDCALCLQKETQQTVEAIAAEEVDCHITSSNLARMDTLLKACSALS